MGRIIKTPVTSTEEPIVLQYTNPQDIEIGPRTIEELPIQEPIVISGYEDNGIKPDLTIEVPMVTPTEVIVEPTIYDKYADVIKGYDDGVVRGMTYSIGMEILRYCERVIGKEIPMNLNCNTCVYDLIKLFVNLKNK